MIQRKKKQAGIPEPLKTRPLAPGACGEVQELPQSPVAGAHPGLPPGGNDFNDWVARFAKNVVESKVNFQLLNSANEMRQALVRLRAAEGWKRAACHSGPLTDAICPLMDIPLLRTDRPYDVLALEACDVGIGECDALIAQTGGVLVTSDIVGGLVLSVMTPHLVVLARREQLLPDLPAAFELLKKKYADNYPRLISLITGPRRAREIESVPVLGGQGPKKLTVLCF